MSSRWYKGKGGGYAEWLKGLTEEEYNQHLLDRAKRKSIRKAMEVVIKEQQEQWIAAMNNAAVIMLQKAIQEGDHNAFMAVWDRIIGKPKEEIDISGDAPLPFHSDFAEPTKLSSDFEGFGTRETEDQDDGADQDFLDNLDEDDKDA